MDSNNSQGMRISLPEGTTVKGEKGIYTVKQFLHTSTRSSTVLCAASNGTTCRLKLYNGQHSITNEVQRKTMSVVTKGVLAPFDIGMYGGVPFAVYQNTDATDTDKYPVSQDILIRRIIPQLAYVINAYHRNRILLRDICPEHVLYQVREQQIAYCGFNNMTVLPDKATITKEPGYGQNPSFIAPEVPKYGYSTCSDYYSLGVTLLSMILGKNPMKDTPWEAIQKSLQSGNIPGIDIAHLKNTPYELYNEEDKVLYLVLGLMMPNPKDRWGLGEIRCWCNNQHIPLVRKEGRIPYQYNEPFIVNNYKCWNYQQITQRIASEKSAWSDVTFQNLDEFAKRQKISNWQQIYTACMDGGSTEGSRIFKALYGINPALDGFWWEGKKYSDTSALVREAEKDKAVLQNLSEILTTNCLSYFLKMRKRVSSVPESEIREMEQIEQWETAEPLKGVNRCIMRFAGNKQTRSFQINGTDYKSIEQLLNNYSNNGATLKNMSADILQNKSFQAWLWANGLEDAGTEAARIAASQPEQSYYLLLKLAESTAKSDNSKRLIRKMYLTFGEYAPIYWLTENINNYKMVSIVDQVIYDVFKKTDLSLSRSLEQLSHDASLLVSDYQHFVARTAKSPLEVECIDLEFCDFSFYPVKEDGFFCCKWDNNLEVSPAFLYAAGSQVQQKTLDSWIKQSIKTADGKLDEILRNLTAYNNGVASEQEYTMQCNRNIVMSVLAIVVAICVWSRFGYGIYYVWIAFAAALVFPCVMIFWYYQKKIRARIFYSQKNVSDARKTFYQEIKNSLDQRGRDCVSRIVAHTSHSITPFQNPFLSDTDNAASLESIDLNGSVLYLSVLSAIGYFAMFRGTSDMTFLIGIDSGLMIAMAYKRAIKSFSQWFIVVLLLMLLLYMRIAVIGTISAIFLDIVLIYIIGAKYGL